MTEVLVHVVGYPDSDQEERADLSSRLRDEIRVHGIDDVSHPPAPPPPGSKGGDRLSLDEASHADRQRLLETFLGRHGDR